MMAPGVPAERVAAVASTALPASFSIEHRVHCAFRRRDFVGVQHGPHDNGFGIERFRPDIASRCARVPLDLETVNRSGPGFAPFSRHANIHDSGRELRLAVECLMNRHPQLAQSNFWPGCRSRMGKIVRRSAPRGHGARATLPTLTPARPGSASSSLPEARLSCKRAGSLCAQPMTSARADHPTDPPCPGVGCGQ